MIHNIFYRDNISKIEEIFYCVKNQLNLFDSSSF